MPSSSVSRETPRQWVPSLDHWVTQWMSVVMSSAGSAVNCFQSHLVVSPVSVVMVNFQVAVLTGGVGPAWRTGNPRSRYWPGGSLGSSRLRPVKPRDTTLMRCLPPARSSVQLRSPVVGDAARGAGHRLLHRVGFRGGEGRARLIEVFLRVGPEPALPPLEAACDRVAGFLFVRGGVLRRRVVAAADVAALGAAA